MKSIIKISAYIGAALLMLGVTSCQQHIELDTAQYAEDVVKLASFGPNPVMRGAQLRFFGSNLDQIVSVEVPGISAITSIEVVSSGKVSEIRITLPVEGPEVGYVTLTSKAGETFTTFSQLSYTEPIVFDSFDAPSPALPGDVVTLNGDYMTLVKTVQFEGGEVVDVNEGATRHSATVTVPAKALTGKIVLSDGGAVENLFYSSADLVIGEPTVTKAAVATLKAGDEFTISGKHLEMIEKLVVGGVEVTDFTLAEDGSSITFVVPAETADGDILAVSFAGVSYNAGAVDAVAPVISSVSPLPVKAGGDLTISGVDLDLVTSVSFDGAENAAFTCEDGVIVVTVPAAAKEGKVTLATANGAKAAADFTLVHPAVTEVSPIELYAGDEITVKGTDLDLIVSATIGGKEVTVVPVSAEQLTLATSASSVGGNIILSLANGETVAPEEVITMSYHSKVIVNSINAAQHIGQPVSITGEKLKLIENIYIGTTKVTDYELRTDEQIVFNMPWCKVGSYPVKFALFDGDVEEQPGPIEVQLELQITNLFTGSEDLGSWSNQPYFGADGALNGIAKVGDIIRVQYAPYEDHTDYNVQIYFGHWDGMIVEIKADTVPYTGYYDIPVTADNIDKLTQPQGWGGVILAQGQCAYVTRVDLIHEISQEREIWTGEAIADAWGNQPYILDDASGADNGIVEGATVTVYFEKIRTDEELKLQLVEGHWGPTYWSVCSNGADTESGKFLEIGDGPSFTYSMTVTADMASAAAAKQWWGGVFLFNGTNAKITKITVL